MNTMPNPASEAAARIGRYRWVICGLLFFGLVINYVHRQTLGILKPNLMDEFGWSEVDYADIVFWFQCAYAIGYVAFGRIVDQFGAKLGFSIAFIFWTVMHMAHGLANGLLQFTLARIGLGLGESGVFPAGVKAVTEWFPRKERALATGIFNAGSNIGAIVTPIAVPAIVMFLDWRWAFYITGGVSLLWLVAWWLMYRNPAQHPSVGAAELAHITQDPPDAFEKTPWTRVIRSRETWAYALGKFLIDPIWWFYLFWLPGYLGKQYDLDLASFGPPLVVIYLLADVGSVGGGWLSSRLISRGMKVGKARKLTMLLCACLVAPIMGAQYVDNLWLAVLLIGLATAAHQGFSANLYTLPSDVFPRSAVGSVIGVGGMIGAIGGMIFSKFTGQVLDQIGSYTPIFIAAGVAYFLAIGVVQLLSPRYEQAKIG